MRISAKAQYACIAMIELAGGEREPQVVQVKTIAEVHGISQRFLVQILLQLKVHGLVRSIRGAAGGYQLARRPANISLSDIIHAIDHATPPVPSALAALEPTPVVQAVSSVLQKIDARERQMLDEITLADLVRRAEPSGAASYQI